MKAWISNIRSGWCYCKSTVSFIVQDMTRTLLLRDRTWWPGRAFSACRNFFQVRRLPKGARFYFTCPGGFSSFSPFFFFFSKRSGYSLQARQCNSLCWNFFLPTPPVFFARFFFTCFLFLFFFPITFLMIRPWSVYVCEIRNGNVISTWGENKASYHMTRTAPRAISLENHKKKGPVWGPYASKR